MSCRTALTHEQMLRVIGISRTTLSRRLNHDKEHPLHKLTFWLKGGHKMYDPADVEQCLAEIKKRGKA